MGQIALPLSMHGAGKPSRIVLGPANEAAFEALRNPASWPYRTAVLKGADRSGKSLAAQWFAQSGLGEAIDDADTIDETELFHRWNRAQEEEIPLLLTAGDAGWEVTLPDLRSRLGAALMLEIGVPDDAMIAALIEEHAARRGLALGEGALTYLVPRAERSFAGIERLVAMIDRLSLERKAPATLSIWRDALAAVLGAEQPRLI